MPRLERFVPAEYPTARRERGEVASVLLTIELSATGDVTKVTVQASAGADFDDAAIAAAKQFHFEPAEVDNKPAPAKITYRYDFTLSPAPNPQPNRSPAPDPSPPPKPLPAPLPPDVTTIEARSAASRKETGGVRVSADEARRVPGTQGDVLKVVQNLPGVSRPPLASGQLVVWGSAPNETRVLIDGVEVPALYHGSGLRSVVSSDFVSSVELSPGAFGAEYGRGLGGLVRVDSRDIRKDGPHTFVAADTLDTAAMHSRPITEDVRASVLVRYSYLDALVPLVTSKDTGATFPIPRYGDFQAKTTFDVGPRESLDVVGLGSFDALDRTVGSPDPGSVRSVRSRASFERVYARWVSSSLSQTSVVTPFAGYEDNRLEQHFGGTPATLDVGSAVYGLRASRREKVGERAHVTVGLDALGRASTVSHQGSLTLPPREGDVSVFGQPPGDDVANDRYKTHVLNVAPDVATDIALGPATFTLGVRMENYLIEGSRQAPKVGLTPEIGFSRLELAFDPRAAARVHVADGFFVTAAGGLYRQAPAPEDLSAVFGTPALSVSKATHGSLAEEVRVTETTTVEVTEFVKTLSDLAVRTQLPSPILARVLTQNGEGRSFGAQLLVRQELTRGFFAWLSYTISRSERRNVGDDRYRLFDYDQPHVLAAVASYEVGRFTFGLRFRASSGYPRTAVIASTYDAKSDRYDPIFGAQNASRLPAFYQLDAKIDRVFPLGEGRKLTLYLDVENVTAHANAEEYVYSFDYSRRGAITGLPTIAVVGVRVDF